jgi:hypothetical protein
LSPYLANALKDVDRLLEVADMENRQFKGDVAEVAGTVFQCL